jgi:AcrR family transcriptional regulator
MPARASERSRDAERSREAILSAADALFAEHGYDATSLSDIGARAGLSRGAPSYFFGSKERLYVEVLERAFAARQSATEAAFEPVRAWCAGDDGIRALRKALASAAAGYMDFLATRPTFVTLIMREELGAGRRIRERAGASTAMQDAFAAVRRTGRRRGLRAFDVDEAVLLFIALTFAPFSYQATLMRALGRDLSRAADRRRQIGFAVDQLTYLLTGDVHS